MSNIQDYLRKGADLLDIVTDALEAISTLTQTTKDDDAVAVLKAVAALAATARAGVQGAVTQEVMRKQLVDFAKFLESIKASDNEAFKKLRARFPTQP